MHKSEKGRRFLEEFMSLIRSLSIGSTGWIWKPVQTEQLLLSTGAALAIQEELLMNHGFSFVLFSRLSQDALENFFTTIRLRNPVPKPRTFKSALRSASLAQFLRPNANGSYAASKGEMFVGIKDKKANQKPVSVICPTQPMLTHFSPDDAEAFEYLCGYVVCKVNKNFKTCNICAAAILQDKPLKECSRLLQLKSFIAEKMPMVTPSGPALMLLKASEAFFSLNREAVLNNRTQITVLKKAILKVVKTGIPDCHSVPDKLVHCF